MEYADFTELVSGALEPEALERTLDYLTEHLRLFLRRQERVLICFPNRGKGSFGALLEQAVRRAAGIPQFWGPDYRWKALLRQAFSSRATVIAGPPFIILGLTKLARATETPLYIRNVLLAGAPGAPWIFDGIQKGLDCHVWGCYCPGTGPVVAGFTCPCAAGIHLRTEEYNVRIVNEAGTPVPEGEPGKILLFSKGAPSRRSLTKEKAMLITEVCPCGSSAPRLHFEVPSDDGLFGLQEQLLSWFSILDYRVRQAEYGLEMEVVTFPGELPKLPTCAKRLVRPWDPERDMPFSLQGGWNYDAIFGKNH